MNDENGKILAEFPIFAAEDEETTMLNLFRFEMRKTRLQFKRVEEDLNERKTASKSTMSADEGLDSRAKLFADIHFLLACLKRLELVFLKILSFFPEDVALKEINERYKERLHFWGSFRNDLEHVEDRPGKGIDCLGSTFGHVFQFDDRQIEISQELRDEIEAFFGESVLAYDKILIARRKASGQKLLKFRSKIKIPGDSAAAQLKEDKNGESS